MIGHSLNDCGHQHRQCWTVPFNGGERYFRNEARMDRHGGTVVQGRRGLNVKAADVEKRQHGEHMIIRGEGVHVLAHHPVPQ